MYELARQSQEELNKTRKRFADLYDFAPVGYLTISEKGLILEANLIREHKPQYNVDLRDDKHFPYIKVTTNEPFPQVLIVRRLHNDGATYFGPFTSSKGMRRTVTFLCRLFKIRTCNYVIPHPKGKKYTVCLDYRINRCGGACEGLQSEAEYKELVDELDQAALEFRKQHPTVDGIRSIIIRSSILQKLLRIFFW